jgi:hypothetical protein
MIVLYVILKFFIYCCLCGVLAQSFNLQLNSRWNFSIAWGTFRLLAGLAFGALIGIAYVFLSENKIPDTANYLFSFGFLRIIEWSLFFAIIARKHQLLWSKKAVIWVFYGVLASMLTDGFAILTGANQIKFFC